ncbi:DNA polymerase III subunit epsilon [Candidatus Odyssella acanthamoebae]|uniref:DNA polymerase III subunit epsilon n=1 Tax=Candidatus Odyssella acanthamoebae TaxID=91604 RepID=A0A077AYI9_9PROT|nr:DNA polymerase III subunit epsilon [Candidatus Paracaedibacter acanthamoebae]AIK97054.1 DNA polymerase III subunit epsilon [Candidatus Paracaedibacter acanthamoebae]
MREIVLDTETTGFNPKTGDRIIEIGCIELHNLLPTGKTYHTYVNPQRDVPPGASKVSGITTEFLYDKPLFVQVVDPFLEFIGDSPLIIHNASFDMGFINAELERLCRNPLSVMRAIDTVQMARQKFPGSPASLDALCRRFGIDLSARVTHGALLDAGLLASVYLELKGGRQVAFAFQAESQSSHGTLVQEISQYKGREFRPSRSFSLSEEECQLHQEFISGIKNALWTR